MTRKITIRSYAKLNYTLDVLSRREDGYHGIASVMQCISLADTITVQTTGAQGITLECSAPGIPSDASNLAARAAAGLLADAGRTEGLRITLDKRIPSQAGLGGGSSNAAYTLLAVDALLWLGTPPARLSEIAATLGSDVPFFLTGGTALAGGRGENLTPLPDGPPLWFVVVKPEASVSTPRAYQALDAIMDRRSARSSDAMRRLLAEGDAERIVARMTNDFEQTVLPDYLSVALLFDDLTMARARNARLCGSGAAVFGVAVSEAEAERIAASLRRKYAEVYVCRALTREESLMPQCEVDA